MPRRSGFRHSLASTAILVIVLLLAGLSLAVGCVSTGTRPDQPSTTTAVAIPAIAADAELRIITEELPPFSYAGADGKVTGQSTEVVNGILARLNQTRTIELLPWSEGYAAALRGPRVALYSTGRTDEREHLFKWAGPITAYDFTFYTRNGSAITVTSVAAAKAAGQIGVVKDDARYQFLRAQNFTTVVTCDTDAECLRNLLANRTDLWFGSAVNFPATVKKEGVDPLALREVYQVKTVPMYIAFSPDTPDRVVAAWQEALDGMKQDGTFASIRQKYDLSAAL